MDKYFALRRTLYGDTTFKKYYSVCLVCLKDYEAAADKKAYLKRHRTYHSINGIAATGLRQHLQKQHPELFATLPLKQPLTAISNAIELKPGKKYLLVFKPEQPEKLDMAALSCWMGELRKAGVTAFSMTLRKGDEIEVIEAA